MIWSEKVTTTQRKWLLVVGVIAVAIALTLGVPVGTLLLFGALLLCPAAMYFGMGGMQQGCGHSGNCDHEETPEQGSKTQDFEQPKGA